MTTTTTQTMTSKQRWLAALDLQPVDRLPFWPKINPAYARAQAEPWKQLDPPAIHGRIGSDRHVGIELGLREVRRRTRLDERPDGQIHRTVFVTPTAELEYVLQIDEHSGSWHPIAFPVRGLDDIKRMTEWFEDGDVEIDDPKLAEARAAHERWGEDAVTAVTIGTSALMRWVEHLAGIEEAHLLLNDYPDECAALFEAIQRGLLRRAELLTRHHPADLFYMVENTSTTLISVQQYRDLDVPHLAAIGRIVTGAGRRLMLHMCGHLKALLPDLALLPVSGFEAFTAPTLGNATLLDGRSACPDKAIVGGTHAMLWLEPVTTITRFIRERLDELPHHRGIVVSSAGVMPPGCPPEKIREVCEWVKEYPVRIGPDGISHR